MWPLPALYVNGQDKLICSNKQMSIDANKYFQLKIELAVFMLICTCHIWDKTTYSEKQVSIYATKYIQLKFD